MKFLIIDSPFKVQKGNIYLYKRTYDMVIHFLESEFFILNEVICGLLLFYYVHLTIAFHMM